MPAPTGGRARLMAAARALIAERRSFEALGIREIARAAGLSQTAFYRHFPDLETLGEALIDEVQGEILQMFAALGAEAGAQAPEAHLERLVQRYFDYCLLHPQTIVVALSEYHGSLPRMREALSHTLEIITRWIARDPRLAPLLGGVAPAAIEKDLVFAIQAIFLMSMDYLELPERREALVQRAQRLMMVVIAGAKAVAANPATRAAGPV
jgi:AcrR family transcriptional regulator